VTHLILRYNTFKKLLKLIILQHKVLVMHNIKNFAFQKRME